MEQHLFAFITAALWPAVVIFVIYSMRDPLRKLLHRFSSAEEINVTVGSLSVEAKAMRELHESIALGFKDTEIDRERLDALIDTKLRSIYAAIEYEVTKSEVRSEPRIPREEKIKITTEQGKEHDGVTLDISNAGVAFQTPGQLNFHELVSIKPIEDKAEPFFDWNRLRIVRIVRGEAGFYYGATVPEST